MSGFRFYLITDSRNTRHQPHVLLPKLVDRGLQALQVREKSLTPTSLADYAGRLVDVLGEARGAVSLFLNDRADLAVALGFDGVHLRQESLGLERQSPLLRKILRWGVSAHSLAEARAAEEAGAEFITFGPVYTTQSKATYGEPVGLEALMEAATAVRIPLYALGGVTPDRAQECLAAGAHGVATIGAIWNAENPAKELDRFAEALGGFNR